MTGAAEQAVPITDRFDEALAWARKIHVDPRKGTNIPYLSHLLAVSGLLLEMGGDEDEAIAGLLHDVVEDSRPPDDVTVEDVRARFGDAVEELVCAASEDLSMTRGGETWKERKAGYQASIAKKSGAQMRVSLADKIANLRTIVIDAAEGPEFWERFNQPPEFDSIAQAQLWNYGRLAARFVENREQIGERAQPFVDEFLLLTQRLEQVVAVDSLAFLIHPLCESRGVGFQKFLPA